MFIISKDITIELESPDEKRFYFDAVTGHRTNREWDGPAHPIAVGFPKTQAISPKLREVTLTGCVGVAATSKSGDDLFAGVDSRTKAACDLIDEMGDLRECVELEIGDKVYENVFLRRAQGNHPRDDFSEFTLVFKEISVFNPSETFNAAIGSEADLGEITAGRTTNIDDQDITDMGGLGVLAPLPDGDLGGLGVLDLPDDLSGAPALPCSSCSNAANFVCLDECYFQYYGAP